MKLKIDRPIVFFDLETTGTNITKDRIVEVSLIKVMPNGEENTKSRKINPEMPIPPEATAIHGITDEDVKDCPKFKQIGHSLAAIFSGCDIAGFNSNRFDIPILKQEFDRAGIDFNLEGVRFIDVQTIYHKKEPRNLSAAYKFYCDKELKDAHTASADTKATLEVFKAQCELYPDLPDDIDKLAEYTSYTRNVDLVGRLVYDENQVIRINFGKHKGEVAEDVLRKEPGYFSWIMDRDFTEDTKREFKKIFDKVKRQRIEAESK